MVVLVLFCFLSFLFGSAFGASINIGVVSASTFCQFLFLFLLFLLILFLFSFSFSPSPFLFFLVFPFLLP